MGDATDDESTDPQLEDLEVEAEGAEGEVDGFMLEGIVAPKIVPTVKQPIQVARPKGIDPIAGVRG